MPKKKSKVSIRNASEVELKNIMYEIDLANNTSQSRNEKTISQSILFY